MTKETILKYNWFVDNEYLDQYLDLVNNSQATDKAEKHHIIPAYYYKLKFPKLRTQYRTVSNNDIDEEIVILSKADHIKAHELLTHCTTGPLQEKMLAAYTYMTTAKRPAKKPAPKKSRKKYASKAEWPSTIKHNTNKAINEIAKKLWYADHTRSWEDCKAEATIIYKQQSTD